MLGWPYEFLTLSDEDKELRRQSLAFYAGIAHLSALLPVLVLPLIRLIHHRAAGSNNRRGGYEAVPGSPAVKARRESGGGGDGGLVTGQWRTRLAWWWMGDDVRFLGRHRLGQRDEWIVGVVWATWLLVLSVLGTGRDYLHLTKRLGLIAASQLPPLYLLSLKSFTPYAWTLRSSYEHINRYHRVLGRVVYALILLHIVLYNVFFVASGIWNKRFFAPVVREGVLASGLLHGLMATAVPQVRSWSYRVFFFVHYVAVRAIPPLLFFHAPSARVYLVEAVVFHLIDFVARRRRTVFAAPATLRTVPGTNLVRVDVALPPSRLPQFQAQPGSHVLIRIPASSRVSQSLKEYLSALSSNPFTVSSIDTSSGTISLIARKRTGPLTTHLSTLLSSSSSHQETTTTKITTTLDIQGPYGVIGKSVSSLLNGGYDRILLFAGGVGATFALPVYRAILHDNPAARVTLIWAVRSAAEATWAVDASTAGDSTSTPRSSSILDDDHVQLFLTGDMGIAAARDGSGMEMADLRRSSGGSGGGNRKRPDVGRIIDDTFRKGREESIAVMVCGPTGMAADVRARVRPWAVKGRRVWWHSEAFGW
ncbi:metalloreductase-like protein [Hapsidospora chrysogenum ATCC 11550]|uniref:Metalloreductase-like protein n=1 Tax=Hapsidospora chrysogenum (strain ATCC 11550 / CBS 779.69 / DSM 880 / IAM 14645 / JCM 23072 / IMI 49137) TaxID=857340 RepID=A0A086SXM7_HAPC1|nr:metalloreductase-like protein [Hapsidospora chrysogenum ATCC 11550]